MATDIGEFDDDVVVEKGAFTSSLDGLEKPASIANEKTGCSKWFEDVFYPPHLPPECHLFRLENMAIPACYLMVGLIKGISMALTNVYPLDLGATEAQQATIVAVKTFPACLKLIFGFISDVLPIGEYRRKPYMLLGWLICSISYLWLLLGSNLSLDPSHRGKCSGLWGYSAMQQHTADSVVALPSHPPEDAPSAAFLSGTILLGGVGFWMADVMGDSLVAEKAKLEPRDSRGSVQSNCYAYRFFGTMVSAAWGTWAYSYSGPFTLVLAMFILPLTMVPLIFLMGEVKVPRDQLATPGEQCHEIFQTVCSRQVWQPMAFIWIYNIFQVKNAAWRQYLRTVLGFTSCQLNVLLIVGHIFLFLGVVSYKLWMMGWSWRTIYIGTTILNGVFSLLQILLIMGITFGLSPYLFALGDDALADFFDGIQYLPHLIMMVHLCPAGSEGASYAMFTTATNSAKALSLAISTMLLGVWDVSKEALENNELQGLINLTILKTIIHVSPILLVWMLPSHLDDLERLKTLRGGTSRLGGILFLSLTFLAMAYSIVVAILNIAAPGWIGET